jgi:hypothetical protein
VNLQAASGTGPRPDPPAPYNRRARTGTPDSGAEGESGRVFTVAPVLAKLERVVLAPDGSAF